MKRIQPYILLLIITLSSCSGDKNNLIGSWEATPNQMHRVIFEENGTVIFESDDSGSDSSMTFEFEILSNNSDYIELEISSFKDGQFVKKALHKATFENPDKMTLENLEFPEVKSLTYQRVTEQYLIDQANKKNKQDSIRFNNLENTEDSLQFANELCFIDHNYEKAYGIYRGIVNMAAIENLDTCEYQISSAYLGLIEVELSRKPTDTIRVFNLIDSAQYYCPSSGETYLTRASNLLYFDMEGAEEYLNIAYEKYGGVTYNLNSCMSHFRKKINFDKIKFDWENVEFE